MTDVDLRPARTDDLELMLAWRSNPEIYRHFREQDGPLSWEEHVKWFNGRPPGRLDLVVEYGDRRVGVVSVAEDGEVGIYIGETALWGEGIASEALGDLLDVSGRDTLYAEVHSDNEGSRRLFERAGFEPVEERGEWLIYRYER